MTNKVQLCGVVCDVGNGQFRATYWMRADRLSHIDEGPHEHEMCASEGEAWALIAREARTRSLTMAKL